MVSHPRRQEQWRLEYSCIVYFVFLWLIVRLNFDSWNAYVCVQVYMCVLLWAPQICDYYSIFHIPCLLIAKCGVENFLSVMKCVNKWHVGLAYVAVDGIKLWKVDQFVCLHNVKFGVQILSHGICQMYYLNRKI